FLITQLLVRELERSGRISILGFYARRARRILPASTVVLVATAAASVLWLGAARAPAIITDTVWAAFFAVNIRLANQGTDYFAQDLPVSPVQHYWSLAVEEQFYIVWPLVIIAVAAVAARSRSARRRADDRPAAPYGRLLVVMVGITGGSFAWSIVATTANPTSTYFSTLPRAWELGVGACGAIWLARRAADHPRARPVQRLLA
ncbi:MAG: acyltransferase family protein, partial [Actinomycetes bacterium]